MQGGEVGVQRRLLSHLPGVQKPLPPQPSDLSCTDNHTLTAFLCLPTSASGPRSLGSPQPESSSGCYCQRASILPLQRGRACQEVCGPTVRRSIKDYLVYLLFFPVCMCECLIYMSVHLKRPERGWRVGLEVTSCCELPCGC